METTNGKLKRKLRMALVGGGIGSFIGRVHVTAAILDNRAQLVAGALSSDPERARQSALSYDIPEERAYSSWSELIEREASLPESQRVDFISVATPNHLHFPVTKAALEAGFNVICDKPLTLTLSQAEELLALVESSDCVFGLTHNYTGYPLVRQARDMVLGGDLGEIQAVRVNYVQGGLCTPITTDGSVPVRRSSKWKNDPAQAGPSGTFGDVGTHAFNLGRYVTGLFPQEISCHLKTFTPDRPLDDYGHAIIRYESGALGLITASQVSHGRENDIVIEVDGNRGSLIWRQEDPNRLEFRRTGQPHSIYARHKALPYLSETAQASSRIPHGHPEGFFEAFANIYRAVFDDIVHRACGEDHERKDTIYPNIYDGVEGVFFLEQCVASSRENAAWLPLKHFAARR